MNDRERFAIAGDFDGLSLVAGSDVYIGMGAAAAAVELRRQQSLVIVGPGGVRTDGIVKQALNDYIADFSTLDGTWDERVEASAVAALRLMNVWQGCPEFLDFYIDVRGPVAKDDGIDARLPDRLRYLNAIRIKRRARRWPFVAFTGQPFVMVTRPGRPRSQVEP